MSGTRNVGHHIKHRQSRGPEANPNTFSGSQGPAPKRLQHAKPDATDLKRTFAAGFGEGFGTGGVTASRTKRTATHQGFRKKHAFRFNIRVSTICTYSLKGALRCSDEALPWDRRMWVQESQFRFSEFCNFGN